MSRSAAEPGTSGSQRRSPTRPGGARSWLIVALMLLGVFATYRSPELFTGHWRLFGLDYLELHIHRVDFATSEFAEHGWIPGWYPREQLGVPFWSNVQSFSFLPTRLLLLATGPLNLFTLAVYLSLALTSVFTFLFARRIGVNDIGAAVAGFTFACSGYFAARVLAGHLGMLEAFPALPILLWTIERVRDARPGRALAAWTALLALECGSFSLAAHPQLSSYALAAAVIYVAWRCGRIRVVSSLTAMALGVAASAFALLPMAELVARSSRVLPDDGTTSDIAMPYARLASLLFPWQDGAPRLVVPPVGIGEFKGYPNQAYFWDTVCYLGWAPLAAVIVLIAWSIARRRMPRGPALFLVSMALVALILSLPIEHSLLPSTSFLVLRSPARLMYLVSFAAALGLGAVIHLVFAMPSKWANASAALASVILCVHGTDLYFHDRCFMRAWTGDEPVPANFEKSVRETVGDGRLGMDAGLPIELNRRIDDIGFFDSIMLASTYRALLDLSRLPNGFDRQRLQAWQLDARTLRACCVRLLVTEHEWPDHQPIFLLSNLRVYETRDVAARVARFPAASARYFTPDGLARALRDPAIDPATMLLLPESARDAAPVAVENPSATMPDSLSSRRVNSDRFEIDVASSGPSWVRVIESWDEGWRATLDGRSVPIFPAQGLAMAVPVPSGKHELVLEFFTPGQSAGLAISAIGVLLLLALLAYIWRSAPRSPVERANAAPDEGAIGRSVDDARGTSKPATSRRGDSRSRA